MSYTKIISTALIMTGFIACSGAEKFSAPDSPRPGGSPLPKKLSRIESCDVVADVLKKQAIARVEKVKESLMTCPQFEAEDAISMSTPTGEESDSSFTGTNLQEAKVDEGDMVKTNGENLFVIYSDTVNIFATNLGDKLELLSTIENEGILNEIYLDGNKLYVIGNSYGAKDCDDAEMCAPVPQVFLNQYDVSDAKHPRLMSHFDYEGGFLKSKKTGNNLHLILAQNLYLNIPFTDIHFSEGLYTEYFEDCQHHYNGEDTSDNFQKSLEAEYSAIVKKIESHSTQIEDLLPEYALVFPENSHGQTGKASCTDVSMSDEALADTSTAAPLYSIVSINMNATDPLIRTNLVMIPGWAVKTYASDRAIYLAAANYDYIENGDEAETQIHQFIFDENGLNIYTASGAVPGTVLNSYSMDEENKTFRLVTTTGDLWKKTSESHLYVLDADDADLKVLGSVSNIGKGENVYSARFVEEKAYVVTFEKVDPLYVIDLADAKNPKISGELKIPGFSNYLHLIDENTVLGIGKDAEDVGDFSWFQGMKLSLFDVADDANPLELDAEIFGGRGTTSAVLTDPHAFTYDAASGNLYLPVTYYSESAGKDDYGIFEYEGVHVYNMDSKTGIHLVDTIEFPNGIGTSQRTLMMTKGGQEVLYVVTSSDVLRYKYTASGYQQQDVLPLAGSYAF